MAVDPDRIVEEVAEDQKALEGQTADTRKRVIRMGKKLTRLQKWQKKEQEKAKAAGEPPQPWKEWCEEQKGRRAAFPAATKVKCYVLISKYPGAYAEGMSIKEAYREAGKWKKNGGNPPLPEKVSIKACRLSTIQVAASKLHGKIEKLSDEDFNSVAEVEDWSEDDILGAIDELTILRQDCNGLLKQLRQFHESFDSEEAEVEGS